MSHRHSHRWAFGAFPGPGHREQLRGTCVHTPHCVAAFCLRRTDLQKSGWAETWRSASLTQDHRPCGGAREPFPRRLCAHRRLPAAQVLSICHFPNGTLTRPPGAGVPCTDMLISCDTRRGWSPRPGTCRHGGPQTLSGCGESCEGSPRRDVRTAPAFCRHPRGSGQRRPPASPPSPSPALEGWMWRRLQHP